MGTGTIPYVQPSKKQTHADQLDGSAGRGLIRFASATKVHDVFVKAGAAAGWEAFASIPDPEQPGVVNDTLYKVGELLATDDGRISIEAQIPAMGGLVITSTNIPGQNPTAQVTYSVEHAR